ncbi:hypothetical protein LSTR_LSTR006766 [Laodelphax striatellus]|uniref:Uncharacterized protein n=1 Tax=Laodelphax striatellus TaxID=195883 RepID=A0A482XFA1_LAOST|nr:hypothetical protein LSTR_LSTR006766 [Laodelphax striatellus]
MFARQSSMSNEQGGRRYLANVISDCRNRGKQELLTAASLIPVPNNIVVNLEIPSARLHQEKQVLTINSGGISQKSGANLFLSKREREKSLLAESDQVGRPGVRGPKSIELDGTLLAVGNKSRRQKKSLGLSSEWDTDSGRPGVPHYN